MTCQTCGGRLTAVHIPHQVIEQAHQLYWAARRFVASAGSVEPTVGLCDACQSAIVLRPAPERVDAAPRSLIAGELLRHLNR